MLSIQSLVFLAPVGYSLAAMKTRHQQILASDAKDREERQEQQTRKRMRELLGARPEEVATAVAALCHANREALHPDRDAFSCTKKEWARTTTSSSMSCAAEGGDLVPRVEPREVLGEDELKAYYSFVCSSGRCRRDCPELYSHLLKRVSALRREEEADIMHSDMK